MGGLPEDLAFDLVEPLRQLFKDEVRAVGEELGLPARDRLAPALPRARAWRCASSGEVTPERAEILRAADAVVVEEIRKAGLYRELWQSFAVLPAVRTVGVMGDGRTYAYPIVIRAVTSDDAMTADWARLPYDLVERIASRIINEVDGRQPGGPRRDVEAARAPSSGSERVGPVTPAGCSPSTTIRRATSSRGRRRTGRRRPAAAAPRTAPAPTPPCSTEAPPAGAPSVAGPRRLLEG